MRTRAVKLYATGPLGRSFSLIAIVNAPCARVFVPWVLDRAPARHRLWADVLHRCITHVLLGITGEAWQLRQRAVHAFLDGDLLLGGDFLCKGQQVIDSRNGIAHRHCFLPPTTASTVAGPRPPLDRPYPPAGSAHGSWPGAPPARAGSSGPGAAGTRRDASTRGRSAPHRCSARRLS